MKLPDQLRDPQITQTAGPALRLAILAAADRIEELEAERDDALQDLHHYKKHLASVEAEVHRLRHFAWVVEEHAENLVNEAAIALHPAIVVDVVKDGTIAYVTGHGPDDPPRPVQRHA